MTDYILAIDQGTTSSRAIVFGKDVTGVKASPLTDERFSSAEFKS